jgi:hypothetical protein
MSVGVEFAYFLGSGCELLAEPADDTGGLPWPISART